MSLWRSGHAAQCVGGRDSHGRLFPPWREGSRFGREPGSQQEGVACIIFFFHLHIPEQLVKPSKKLFVFVCCSQGGRGSRSRTWHPTERGRMHYFYFHRQHSRAHEESRYTLHRATSKNILNIMLGRAVTFSICGSPIHGQLHEPPLGAMHTKRNLPVSHRQHH